MVVVRAVVDVGVEPVRLADDVLVPGLLDVGALLGLGGVALGALGLELGARGAGLGLLGLDLGVRRTGGVLAGLVAQALGLDALALGLLARGARPSCAWRPPRGRRGRRARGVRRRR